jgi:hypothetical protein
MNRQLFKNQYDFCGKKIKAGRKEKTLLLCRICHPKFIKIACLNYQQFSIEKGSLV